MKFKKKFGLSIERFHRSCIAAVLCEQCYSTDQATGYDSHVHQFIYHYNSTITGKLTTQFPSLFQDIEATTILSQQCTPSNKMLNFNPFYISFTHNKVLYPYAVILAALWQIRYISVRGSLTLEDWLTNFSAWAKTANVGSLHSGFSSYADMIYSNLFTYVTSCELMYWPCIKSRLTEAWNRANPYFWAFYGGCSSHAVECQN